MSLNKKQIKELMFEQVEFSDYEDFSDSLVGELTGYDYENEFTFICHTEHYKYIRKIQPKEKRLLTAQELVGKWLVNEHGDRALVTFVDEEGCIRLHGLAITEVSQFHSRGWKVNDKPSFEGAVSLEVEK